MATIVTRSGKGSALTHTEMDANFNNLNNAKAEQSTLGTAASKDVTTSQTDTTAGRLLKVGDFGIAGYSPAITSSADNYELPGYNIWLNSASTEKPSWAGSGILLPLPAVNAVTNSQFFIASAITDTKTPSLNIRQKNAVTGDWNDWQEVYHTGNTVGTVSQSGGVPTGAIIERGSNANGEYVKYADGTMICFFESLTNIITSTKVGYIYSNSPSTSFNFPVTFSATPRVSPAGRYTSGLSTASLFIRNVSTTVVTLHAYSHANNGEVTPGYTAIGRWY
jgi:hypothetical protein